MNDSVSGLTKEMLCFVKGGGNISHILTVDVSRSLSVEERERVRQTVFALVANKPITKRVNGHEITLTWRASNTVSAPPCQYHCDAVLFSDAAVHAHTLLLLRDLPSAVDCEIKDALPEGTATLALRITKPLTRQVPLIDDDLCLH